MAGSDYIPRVTSEDVQRIVSRDFADRDRVGVLSALNGYGTEPGYESVQAAILKLSAGNAASVSKYVDAAKLDYRDVVGPAEEAEFFEIVARRTLDGKNQPMGQDDWAHYFGWPDRRL